MAESSSYIAGTTPTYTITHEDGSAVTPQEVYDALMSGPVILEMQGSNQITSAFVVTQFGYKGTPSNVTVCYLTGPHNTTITIGGE